MLVFKGYGDHRELHVLTHAYPTRRSSDLRQIEAAEDVEGEDSADGPLKLAIIGRPNAGKSNLINQLLGQERLITGPEAGITRDSISIDWEWQGRPVRRSDEHTSELQSLMRTSYAVFCLKKKKTTQAQRKAHTYTHKPK